MYPMSVVPTLVCDDKFDGFHLHSVGAYQNNTFNGDPTIQLLIDIQGQGGGVRHSVKVIHPQSPTQLPPFTV